MPSNILNRFGLRIQQENHACGAQLSVTLDPTYQRDWHLVNKVHPDPMNHCFRGKHRIFPADAFQGAWVFMQDREDGNRLT